MNKKLNYKINLSGLNVVKHDLHNAFFYKGHPEFLIPDFDPNPVDIWISFMNYLERTSNKEIYDQDGGEISSHSLLDTNGLVECVYEAYGINFDEDEDPLDYQLAIRGYIIDDSEKTYFLAESVEIK